MGARILLAEDNEKLAAGIKHNLELEGYEVATASTGTEALTRARTDPPDLLILDIMMPEKDGFEVLRQLRGEGFDRPVLVLTALADEADKVRGFRLRADQYITKPFGLMELLERVRSLLARSAGSSGSGDGTFRFGDITVDAAARVVTRDGQEVSLTPKAFSLLLTLIEHEGRVLSRQELLRKVWGHLGAVVTRTVDSHVSELRQKLEEDPSAPRHIHTVWKAGYRFDR